MRPLARLAVALALLPLTATAREPRTLKLRFPPFHVPPGTNPEACVAIRVPSTTPFDVATFEIRHRGATHGVAVQHFLVYAYTGNQLAGFPDKPGPGVQSRGCLELGLADPDQRQLIVASTARRSETALLPGGALRLAPVPLAPGGAPAGLGFVLDAEWLSAGSRTQKVSSVVSLRRAKALDPSRVALLFSDRSAEAGLLVPPFVPSVATGIGSTDPVAKSAGWGPGRPGAPEGDLCVLMVTGQMHKRGRFFGADLVGPDGQPVVPGTVADSFEPGLLHLFGGFDWTDMGSLARPLRLTAGQFLHYECWADNGSARAERLGCEEVSGTIPGAVGQPAKPCMADGDCPPMDPMNPGRSFTGRCVPADLVAGSGIEDEVCRLNGVYVPAVAGGPCGGP